MLAELRKKFKEDSDFKLLLQVAMQSYYPNEGLTGRDYEVDALRACHRRQGIERLLDSVMLYDGDEVYTDE